MTAMPEVPLSVSSKEIIPYESDRKHSLEDEPLTLFEKELLAEEDARAAMNGTDESENVAMLGACISDTWTQNNYKTVLLDLLQVGKPVP